MDRVFLFYIFLLVIGCNADCRVYLCNGPSSVAYHKVRDCKGLRRCTTDVEVIDIAIAKEKGKRECGYCYQDNRVGKSNKASLIPTKRDIK